MGEPRHERPRTPADKRQAVSTALQHFGQLSDRKLARLCKVSPTLVDDVRRHQPRPALYRHFDSAGALLYVGVSLHVRRRLLQHRQSRWFAEIATTTVEFFPNMEAARAAEWAAILGERPRFNNGGLVNRHQEPVLRRGKDGRVQDVSRAAAARRRRIIRAQLIAERAALDGEARS